MNFVLPVILFATCSVVASSITLSEVCNASTWDNDQEQDNGISSPNDSTIFDLILAEKYSEIHPKLPACLDDLKLRGSHRCWHKHSTFHDHLRGVYTILRLWGQDDLTSFVGLFHSAYSNSYVNLALYDPSTERDRMRDLVGEEVENVVYLFCSFDRQAVVVDTLLKNGRIPTDGLDVPHLRHANETIHLSPEILRILVVFTMADIADQYFGWQDDLFGGGGHGGSMIIPGRDYPEKHNVQALWPGVSKPGLWMSYVSELAQIVSSFQMEEARGDTILPPVFDDCSRILRLEDEMLSRDLYWSVVQQNHDGSAERALLEAHELNPYSFEPLVLLAQLSLHSNAYDKAETYGRKALALIRQWGTAYDKRLSLGATTAWTRVLIQRAVDKEPWPMNAWAVNNFGLVR